LRGATILALRTGHRSWRLAAGGRRTGCSSGWQPALAVLVLAVLLALVAELGAELAQVAPLGRPPAHLQSR